MSQSLKLIVSEPAVDTPEAYAHRVRALAILFAALFTLSLIGLAILCWRGRYFVTLSQRSNVETLTLAFFFAIFLYVALLTRTGAWGALRLAFLSRPGGDFKSREQRKMAHLPSPAGDPPAAGLNFVVEREGCAGEAFRIPVADEAGKVGELELDGARVTFRPERDHGANNILAYFVHQVNRVREQSGNSTGLDIVAWKTIDDEVTETHLAMVQFAQNLRKALQSEPLWPCIQLTDEEVAKLEKLLSEVCPALRNESFLPDWEYTAEHKLPIIPEPLGLASLGRSEKRADPVVAMGMMLGLVIAGVSALLLLVAFPPWLPGA